jgi:hypothetical protein
MPATGVELLSVVRKTGPALAKRLLVRYGPRPAADPNAAVKGPRSAARVPGTTARRLTAKVLKLSDEAFGALDQGGDVSRREFLGTDEDFRRLDADGDGLISAQEAGAAEKK